MCALRQRSLRLDLGLARRSPNGDRQRLPAGLWPALTSVMKKATGRVGMRAWACASLAETRVLRARSPARRPANMRIRIAARDPFRGSLATPARRPCPTSSLVWVGLELAAIWPRGIQRHARSSTRR